MRKPHAPLWRKRSVQTPPGENAIDNQVELLREAARRSGAQVRGLFLAFLAAWAYFFVTVTSTTHLDLLMETAKAVPLLNIKLPLLWFFGLGPWILVLIHLNMLLQYYLHARNLRHLDEAIQTTNWNSLQKQKERKRTFNFLLGALRDEHGLPPGVCGGIHLVLWVATIALPLIALGAAQLYFLAYHSTAITYVQRAAIVLDAAYIWYLWPKITGKQPAAPRARFLHRTGTRAVVVVAAVVSLGVLTVPGELGLDYPWEKHGRPLEAWHFQFLDLPNRILIKNQPTPELLAKYVTDPKDYDEAFRKLVEQEELALDLRTRNLQRANFVGSKLFNANLSYAQLQGAYLWGVQLQGADLWRAQLQGADLEDAHLQGANLMDAQLQDAYLEEAQLQGAQLKYANLQNAYLSNAKLQGASLQEAQLQGAKLIYAKLQGADLSDAQLQDASLGHAQLQSADLRYAHLQGARLWRAHLQGADLWRAHLQGANLWNARLQGANLSSAQLQGADLREAQLQGANLGFTSHKGAALWGAQLQGADFLQALIQRAGLWGAQLQDALLPQELCETRLRRAELGTLSENEWATIVQSATSKTPGDFQEFVTDNMNSSRKWSLSRGGNPDEVTCQGKSMPLAAWQSLQWRNPRFELLYWDAAGRGEKMAACSDKDVAQSIIKYLQWFLSQEEFEFIKQSYIRGFLEETCPDGSVGVDPALEKPLRKWLEENTPKK